MKLVRPCPDIINSICLELDSPFTLVDVGCAFGIDPPFHDFGDKLVAYGFEPSIEECQRLIKDNRNPNIHYTPAFVKLEPDHPFAKAKAGKSHWSNNPWPHLAVARSLETVQSAHLSSPEKTALNLWADTKLADRSEDIYLNQFLPKQGINSIDLCKIDVDGADFEVLHSLEGFLSNNNMLALVIEVNYFGSDNDTDHTFHNVDRYMRRNGFDLYGLTVNKYSAKSLPAPYYFAGPGENLTGRPYQGDALYVLDVFSTPAQLTRDKILKLVAIFALFGLPDWAAETLRFNGSQLLGPNKIDPLLELLCDQIQEHQVARLNYADYMASFERNDPLFYPAALESRSNVNGERLLEELAQLRAEVASLRESASWKITAPLRGLSRFLRGGGDSA
jgi:hypothetical protein